MFEAELHELVDSDRVIAELVDAEEITSSVVTAATTTAAATTVPTAAAASSATTTTSSATVAASATHFKIASPEAVGGSRSGQKRSQATGHGGPRRLMLSPRQQSGIVSPNRFGLLILPDSMLATENAANELAAVERATVERATVERAAAERAAAERATAESTAAERAATAAVPSRTPSPRLRPPQYQPPHQPSGSPPSGLAPSGSPPSRLPPSGSPLMSPRATHAANPHTPPGTSEDSRWRQVAIEAQEHVRNLQAALDAAAVEIAVL